MSNLVSRTIASPLGVLRLVAAREGLTGVCLPGQPLMPAPGAADARPHPVLDQAEDELGRYFRGEPRSFSTPLAATGTPFQRAVWDALLAIPFGERRSYAWVAEKIGRPSAYRAAGAANGRNPLPIFVPCHRVVGADGALAGYAGGLEAKQWLLDHERRVLGGM